MNHEQSLHHHELTALSYAADALQHAPEQRISSEQKQRLRKLGHAAEAHSLLEPAAIAEGLTLYIESDQVPDVAQAALFFTGTARFDTAQLRRAAPREVLLAAQSLKTLRNTA